MCGRLTLRTPAKDIAEVFNLVDIPDLRPRYNIAPTLPVASVRLDPKDGHRELVMLDWGLIPFWADDRKVGYSPINARAETVISPTSKPLATRHPPEQVEHCPIERSALQPMRLPCSTPLAYPNGSLHS